MQDSRKRGRKPRGDGEKMEKISNTRYKCPYKACSLEYQSSLGYKRHLMYYKHSLFAPSARKIVCGYAGCRETEHLKEHIYKTHPEDAVDLLEAHEVMMKTCEETEELDAPQMEHDIVHDEGLLDISRVLEEDGVIKDIIMTTFPKGVTYIIDFDTFSDAQQVFYCRIPGCGRQFKSLMAYKYHCGKFTHLFKSIVDEYTYTHGELDYKEVRDIFKKKFNLENRFLLEGVSHHLMRMPDQHYNFIFTFDDAQTGHEKRRHKKKSGESISEFSVAKDGEDPRDDYDDEDDAKRFKEDDDDDKSTFRIDSIIFNGKRLPHSQFYKQGRLSFLNLHLEVTHLSTIDGLVLVGTKGEPDDDEEHLQDSMKAQSIFTFGTGNASLFVLNHLEIVSEVTIEGFGFPRKIVNTAPRTALVLFNDGSLQKLRFSKAYKIEEMHRIETKGPVVDFVFFQGMVVTCSHRVLTNLTTRKDRPFESPIISMSTTAEAILIVDANGKTHTIDPGFEALSPIPSKVGTNIVAGLGSTHDLVFISNSLYGLGRIFSIKANSTLLVSPHASSNVLLIRPGYVISSGLDGTLCVSGYETEPKVYMKVIRTEIRGEDLYVITSEEEHALTEHTPPPAMQDYRVCIQGIVYQKTALVAALTCGVIISIDAFFREPPAVLPTPKPA
ncbi:hypothetical protein NEDG_00309 [Nematocida displodere]|uniref:C2H2-type domain-containing protein n=1 Tax=Nematocida displodere TaxID=1805483 RepID=A0A177EIN9_9MICR|nr:hypothetical protein NEDG_00309 [Nematocida displodere]